MLVDPVQPLEPIDCLFSAHVMEHLPDPNVIWKVATSVLKPDGFLVPFTPNGEPVTEQIHGSKRYHQLWGQVHPLLIAGGHLKYIASKYGFAARVYSSPYPIEEIRNRREPGDLTGHELALVARRDSS